MSGGGGGVVGCACAWVMVECGRSLHWGVGCEDVCLGEDGMKKLDRSQITSL